MSIPPLRRKVLVVAGLVIGLGALAGALFYLLGNPSGRRPADDPTVPVELHRDRPGSNVSSRAAADDKHHPP